MQPLKGRFRRSAEGRADPAPSRLKYRLQRWMLTPGIRFGLRFGVPLCLVLAVSGAYLADEGRRDALQGLINDARAAIEERPEFMVKVMAVDGAGTSVAQDIREVVPLDFPVSSFDLDLEQIRDVITGLDPVKSASVRIRPGGILQVDVEERAPAADLAQPRRAGAAGRKRHSRGRAGPPQPASRSAADCGQGCGQARRPGAAAVRSSETAGAAAARPGAGGRTALGRGAGPQAAHYAAAWRIRCAHWSGCWR